MAIESVILSNLIYNEDYTRKVLPYLKEEYFSSQTDRVIYSLINKYIINNHNLFGLCASPAVEHHQGTEDCSSSSSTTVIDTVEVHAHFWFSEAVCIQDD